MINAKWEALSAVSPSEGLLRFPKKYIPKI
jgi:hypothetical protein